MYSEGKTQLKNISSYAGARKDYVQGGGGNTSTKFDDRLMAIKASGYTLGEITEEKGYVTVDYRKIIDYYNTVDTTQDKDFEKESLEAALGSVELLPGMENKRPSVEVGFHAFLKKCVIHTHSVYANILCCCEEGREVADSVFAGTGLKYVFIPYIDPGFRLTFAVKSATAAFEKQHGAAPDVIFLENHGVIVHADTDAEAIAMHEKVNNRIREHFGVDAFPAPAIIQAGQGYASDTEYLKGFIQRFGASEEYFNGLKLYPDQLVYLGGKMGSAIQIRDGEVIYTTAEKEAVTMEETLLGAVYVIDMIEKAGLHLRQMDEKGVSFISNWESEKYRAQQIK